MDDRTWAGALAEIAVAKHLTLNKAHVFTQLSGKAPFDLAVLFENSLRRVTVKGTGFLRNKEYRSYGVGLRSTRANTTRVNVKLLDASVFDILAVYVIPEDTVCYFPASQVAGRTELGIAFVPHKQATLAYDFLDFRHFFREGIRPDEEAVLKTAGRNCLVSSSLTPSV